MKVTTSTDWRDTLVFETPTLLSDAVPGDAARCFSCGADAELRPRSELWAFKHRHPKNHDGYVRFYCRAHVPAAAQTVSAVPSTRAQRTPVRGERSVAARRPAATDVVRAMCPDCFVEVSATGLCGMCGKTAA